MSEYCTNCKYPISNSDYVPTTKGLLCTTCWIMLQEIKGEGGNDTEIRIVEGDV